MFDTIPQHSPRSASEIDIHVGRRVRERRIILGMSQEELANRLNLTFQQVQKYERGINRINAGRLYEIAQLLGVPTAYFYQGVGGDIETAAPTALSQLLTSREGIELAHAFAAIGDPNQRRALIQVARSMAATAVEPHQIMAAPAAEPLRSA